MKNNAMNQGSTLSKRIKYARYLNPADVWAMAFGCIVGWGAFVMPGTTFLPLAGPFASVLAILTGMAIMLVIGKNYSYLMRKNRAPEALIPIQRKLSDVTMLLYAPGF